MIIEFYRDQNLNELRDNVIFAHKSLSNEFKETDHRCHVDYENWHPELPNNYNDTWKLIEMIERFGYHSYYYDTVLYTSEFNEFDNPEKITGDGLTFNQAVCNMFVRYTLKHERRITPKP